MSAAPTTLKTSRDYIAVEDCDLEFEEALREAYATNGPVVSLIAEFREACSAQPTAKVSEENRWLRDMLEDALNHLQDIVPCLEAKRFSNAQSTQEFVTKVRGSLAGPVPQVSEEEWRRLTRPVIGIENRTPQEVFDIMCARLPSPPQRNGHYEG